MKKDKDDLFAKQIHLPKSLHIDLDVQAKREGYGNLKNMIETKTIEGLKNFKED